VNPRESRSGRAASRFIYSRDPPKSHPFSSSQPSLFCCLFSTETRVRSTLIDVVHSFLVTHNTHFQHSSLSSQVQNALHQCQCAMCARGRRRGSDNGPVCLAPRVARDTFNSIMTNPGFAVSRFRTPFSWSLRPHCLRTRSAMRSLHRPPSPPTWHPLWPLATPLPGTRLFLPT
jgi:hypothetical protein